MGFLAKFQLSSGSQHLVASDGRDLFSYNAGGPSWVNRTPLYTTGTAKFTNASTTVEGTGTSWDADNVKAGMKIKNDADGTWYEVDSLTDATHLELTAAFAAATTPVEAYTIRQRRSATGEHWLRGAVTKDDILITNGVDPVLTWDGSASTFSALGGSPPKSRFVTTFHQQNLCVLARGASNPKRLQNSDAADPTEWTTGLAGSYDFEDSGAPITGVDGSHEYLFLFREDGIWRGFWEGFGVAISWARVPGVNGPVYPNSLLRLGGASRMGSEAPVTKWAYFGLADVYAFDGEGIESIGEPVRSWLFDRLDPAYPNSIIGTVIPEWSLAIWSFPTKGSAGVCTESIAFDYKHSRWFPRATGWSAFAIYDLTAGDVQWDNLVGTIDAQARIFDKVGSAPDPVCLVGDEDGDVYYLAFGVNDAGAAIAAQRDTPVFPCDDRASFHEVGAVSFRTTAAAGSQFEVQVYGSERGEAIALLGQATVAVSDTLETVAYLRCGGRYLSVRVLNEETNGEFGVSDLTAWVRGVEG
jgi:hypothetical protein